MARSLAKLSLLAAGAAAQGNNPFCGTSPENGNLFLTCTSGVIDSIPFASYGRPYGSCPNFVANASCAAQNSAAMVAAACVGKSSCVIPVNYYFFNDTDPCPGVVKALAVIAHCSSGTGYAYGGSPSCALNGTACPPPQWPAQWNLTMSTVCQPSSSGYFIPSQPWGLISLDWSVANSIWKKPNQNDSTCEATSIKGCQMIKAMYPETRCFIYHNMELALQAFESQRVVMYNTSTANYFLQYTDGMGHKNGIIYNEPGGPGDQFFWDYRVPAAAQYYISSVMSTLTDPAVDGTFTDDVTGFPAEHENGPHNINMSNADVAEVQYATQATNAALIQALVAAGKYNWQAFGAQDGVGPGVSQSNCASFMRARCTAAFQLQAITMSFDPANKNQSVAGFLVVRPPIAYLGFGWESDMRNWDPIFLTQVGEPQGLCAEGPAGVFTRPWTYGNASLDCNTWTAVIPAAP